MRHLLPKMWIAGIKDSTYYVSVSFIEFYIGSAAGIWGKTFCFQIYLGFMGKSLGFCEIFPELVSSYLQFFGLALKSLNIVKYICRLFF